MSLNRVTTDQLIAELERRERYHPGEWTGREIDRLKGLVEKLDPEQPPWPELGIGEERL
jgi:hypothetical protein